MLLEVAGLNSALASGDEKLIEKGIFERVDGIIHMGRSMDAQELALIDGSGCAVLVSTMNALPKRCRMLARIITLKGKRSFRTSIRRDMRLIMLLLW